MFFMEVSFQVSSKRGKLECLLTGCSDEYIACIDMISGPCGQW